MPDFLIMSGFGDSSLNRPAFEKSKVKKFARHADSICPLRRCQRESIECGIATSARVVFLLFLCRPSTIRWGIWPIVILAIQRMFQSWRMPHILKKLRKILPSLADSYSPCSVILVLMMFGVLASSSHIHPSSIKIGLAHPVGSPLTTTAAFGTAANQTRTINLFPFPAVTFTPIEPSLVLNQFERQIQNGQLTESSICGNI